MRVLIVAALLGCDGTHDRPAEWIAAELIEGTLRPEIVQPPNPVAPRDSLRVVTYNVLKGIEIAEVAPAFLANPELARADVILLQETDQVPFEEPSDASLLAPLLDMGFVYAPTNVIRNDTGTRGLTILSRFPFRDVQVMYLLDAAQIGFNDSSSRSAASITIDAPSGPLRIVNVHLDVALNIPDRILQLRPAVLGEPGPIVVAGDMNMNDYVWVDGQIYPFPLFPIDAAADTKQSVELDAYMRGIGYTTPTANLGNTWHGIGENMRLDAIYTRGVTNGIGGIVRGLEDLSDHRPLWLDVKVHP